MKIRILSLSLLLAASANAGSIDWKCTLMEKTTYNKDLNKPVVSLIASSTVTIATDDSTQIKFSDKIKDLKLKDSFGREITFGVRSDMSAAADAYLYADVHIVSNVVDYVSKDPHDNIAKKSQIIPPVASVSLSMLKRDLASGAKVRASDTYYESAPAGSDAAAHEFWLSCTFENLVK